MSNTQVDRMCVYVMCVLIRTEAKLTRRYKPNAEFIFPARTRSFACCHNENNVYLEYLVLNLCQVNTDNLDNITISTATLTEGFQNIFSQIT